MGSIQRLPPGSRLSKREVECLRWAAIGKTDLEISMIMSRSRATVRFHIHNASTKLDAVNRSQTVFKAAQLGYISLGGVRGAPISINRDSPYLFSAEAERS